MNEYFESWKDAFLESIWMDHLQWNPEKISHYLKNKQQIPLFACPISRPDEKAKYLNEKVESLRLLKEMSSKKEYYLTYGKNLDSINDELFKVLNKHSKKASESLKLLLNVYREQIENFTSDVRSSIPSVNIRRTEKNIKLPEHIAIHLLQPLIYFERKKEGYELIRKFLFDEFYEWRKKHKIELNYTIPSIPSSQQEDTEWARKLKSHLIDIVTKDLKEQRRVINKIKIMNKFPAISLLDSVHSPYTKKFNDPDFFKMIIYYATVKDCLKNK